jgi:hypothetical protein
LFSSAVKSRDGTAATNVLMLNQLYHSALRIRLLGIFPGTGC